MSWPHSQDYNEAIQNPAQCFADAELRRSEAVTNEMGLPQPCSGNFADVYAVVVGDRKWAVKCFTRQIPGLRERYKEISAYLKQTPLSFMVEFSFHEQGIRIRNDWYPILKMQWVEGFTLNDFVRRQLHKPHRLDVLCQLWVTLASRLRDADLAHCDLQHGNVMLVPGSKQGSLAVKLVDYDGMCVPALTLLKSIEVGHPSYQHPQRAKEGIYSLEVDRFPHLVIYTAIRALTSGGKALWEKYDNGDNLLFTLSDFQAPTKSRLFAELMRTGDAAVRILAETMLQALAKPLNQTPLLEELVAKLPVTAVASTSAISTAKDLAPLPPVPMSAPRAEDLFASATAGTAPPRRLRRKQKSNVGLIVAGVVALLPLIGLAGYFAMQGGDTEKDEKAVAKGENDFTRPAAMDKPVRSKEMKKEPATAPKTGAEPKSEPKNTPEVTATPPGPVNLLSLIDVDKDVVAGKWSFQGKVLVSPSSGIHSRLQIPYIPPEDYTMSMIVERKQGNDHLLIGLVVGGRQCEAVFDAVGRSGLEVINGRRWDNNETTQVGQMIKNGRPYEIMFSVRKASVTVTVDGKQVYRYTGDAKALSLHPHWVIPNQQVLFVGGDSSVFHITKMELTPITEQGKHLRNIDPPNTNATGTDVAGSPYVILPFDKAATASSVVPPIVGTVQERLFYAFPQWGDLKFKDAFGVEIPFHVTDPDGGKVKNVIALYGPEGVASRTHPKTVSIPCGVAATTLHFLGCVAGEVGPGNPTTSLIVRLHYENGTSEDHELLKHLHVGNVRPPSDPPFSKQVLTVRPSKDAELQVRYLPIFPRNPSVAIKSIELIKGNDNTSPLMFAITAERFDPAKPGMYLSDMAETRSSVGSGDFGKNGDMGFAVPERGGDRRILVNGFHARKGLSMHAIKNGSSSVTYRLDGKFTSLTAGVAVADGVTTESPLTFFVLGDGKILWRSKPARTSKDLQTCGVNIKGVRELILRVICPGGQGRAHSVWLDPHVRADEIIKSGATVYDSFPEPLRSQLVQEWEAESEALKRAIKDDEERLSRAKTAKDRLHFARLIAQYKGKLATHEKNDPPYFTKEREKDLKGMK